MEIPEPPKCPPKLKEYLELLRQAVMTARPVAGKDVNVDEHSGEGTVINAEDCPSS